MSGFAKVFETILLSSIWTEPDHVLRLWITMLVRADRHGFVEGTVPGLTRLANIREPGDTSGTISLPLGEDAFAKLEAPDPYSKTPDNEGRRIERVERGWVVLNHKLYRDLMVMGEVSMTPEAVRQRRHRERERSVTSVTARDSDVTSYASAAGPESSSGEGVQGEGEPLHMAGEDDPVFTYCTRLAVAANKGLNQSIPRILASMASTRQAAEIIANADIPIEFAERVVFDRAQKVKAPGEVRALSYFVRAVIEEWEREAMRKAVTASPIGKAQVRGGPALAVCPICGAAGIAHGLWTPHFLKHHQRDDVPSFADNVGSYMRNG